MTCIAWDGKVLVADRQVNSGSGKGLCTKIFRLRDGRLFGSAGEHQDALLVRDWLNGDEKRPDNVSENFVAIVITPETVYRLEDKLVLAPIEEQCHAIGSGAHYAIAAMALGKGALTAVLVASRFDLNTGPETDTLRLGAPRKPLRK